MACSYGPAATFFPPESTRPPYDATSRMRWARALAVSERAVELLLESDVIDLHVDTFIWKRLFNYDLRKWHHPGPHFARFLGQTDLPRLRASGVTGATFIITTNPARTTRGRLRALVDNYRTIGELFSEPSADTVIVASASAYHKAQAQGKFAVFLGIQGGNALSDRESCRVFPLERLLLVTLMHLCHSDIGRACLPFGFATDTGLGARGLELVDELERQRVFVDLAHASPKTFSDVVAHHDRSRPLLVSHTGFSEVTPHWRNIDDQQARAVAASGGVVGVIFHGPYLGGAPWGGRVREVARHIAHGVRLLGACHVCLGSDWDGLIATPLDMPTCLELPRLVQALLDEGLRDDDILQVTGRSFLQLLERHRP